MIIIEFNNIHFLKNVIIPLFSSPALSEVKDKQNKFNILNSKKEKDFHLWSILVNIYYYGYKNIPEGASLIRYITTHLNRVSTNKKSSKFISTDLNLTRLDFIKKYKLLSKIPSPYTIKNGIRFYRRKISVL
uniref:LAGLIDADG endonuclease n=1 Tax=Daedaleopsis nitida TaxID=1140402 RepID=UPI0030DDFC84